jgi:hypothetical protein
VLVRAAGTWFLGSLFWPVRRSGRRGRGRDGGYARRGLGPDQQDGAGGVVDDEAGGGTQALGSRVGAVAVAGEDEQVGAFGGGNDLALDPPGSFQLGAGPAQAVGGGLQELAGGGGQLLQAGAGVTLGVAAAEQAGVGAAGGTRDVAAGDVEQDDGGAFGAWVLAASTQAGQVPSTIQAITVTGISLRWRAARPTAPGPPRSGRRAR